MPWCVEVTATARAQQPTNIALLPCESAGDVSIVLECSFPAKSVKRRQPSTQIGLTRAVIRFRPEEESEMQVDLTFANLGDSVFRENRIVYLAVDDINGKNYIRRPLPHVDFRELAPETSKTFREILLVPALRPNKYSVRLWIPSSDPDSKFDRNHNLLLAGTVIDQSTNLIAAFTVTR
jgi:hypothetical protein